MTTTNGIWSSEGARPAVAIDVAERELGLGPDVAIGISVTGDLSEDVLAYIKQASLPVGKFFNLSPADGLGQTALGDDAHARGWAESTLTEIRALTKGGAPRIHVFLYGPNGAAVLLGSLWNRMPPTQLYEDLDPLRATHRALRSRKPTRGLPCDPGLPIACTAIAFDRQSYSRRDPNGGDVGAVAVGRDRRLRA